MAQFSSHILQGSKGSGTAEINETTLNIGVEEFDANVITHFETLKTKREPAFGRRLE